jgi:hypothetical protein
VVNSIVQCSVDACPDAAEVRGWCNKHYLRWKRHGDPEYRRSLVSDSPCAAAGCDDPAVSKGFCAKHYSRMLRNGDPLGGRAMRYDSYAATHSRRIKALGLASVRPCVDCGEPADQWSYQGGCPDELQDEATGCAYCLHDTCYRARCYSCHWRHDHRR